MTKKMLKQRLSFFSVLLCALVSICCLPLNSAYAHTVMQDSTGNTLNLSVNNESVIFSFYGVTVSVTSTPSWISMNPDTASIGDIFKGSSGTATFSFSVGKSPNGETLTGEIVLRIESLNGDFTTKNIPIVAKPDLGKCEVLLEDGQIVEKDCDDGNECTKDICDLETFECIHEEPGICEVCENGKLKSACNDDNECTKDECNPETGECTNTPIELDKCHICKNKKIVPKCSDGNECTEDECNPGTGECGEHKPKKLNKCQVCKNGKIVSKDCGEGDNCTTVYCDPDSGCQSESDPNCDKDNSDPTYIQLPRGQDVPFANETKYQFSPSSSPLIQDYLEIGYEIKYPSMVSALIYDANGTLIRTLANNEIRDSGSYIDEWDGRDDEGRLVPDGAYHFIINGVNIKDVSDTWELSDEIIIDSNPPAADIVFIKEDTPKYDYYTIMGTALDEHFAIYYIELLKDEEYVSIEYGYSMAARNILGVFDAAFLEDGVYTARLTVFDFAGNTATDEIPLIIDRSTNALKLHINSVSQNINLGSEGYLPTSDDPDVWIDDELPPGSTQIDTWEWDTDITYSGLQSHTDPVSEGTHGHYFIHADDPLTLESHENIIQYVYLDPANPPRQILLQFYTDDGDGEHRAYWGSNDILTGGELGTASLYNMGELPPTDKWLRLKIPASVVGLIGKEIKGIAFVTYNGKAWWDKTTKSSDYNETQGDLWVPASQTGSEDSSDVVINYSVSQDAALNLSIYDEENNLIKTLMNGTKQAGTHETGWDGTDSTGNQVPETWYYFQFSTTDGSPIDCNAYGTIPDDSSSQTVTPASAVTDSAGNTYQIDTDTVNKYDASDALIFSITADNLGVNNFAPIALALDFNDNLFIADNSQSRIFKVNPDGYYLIELPYLPSPPWGTNFSLDTPNAISSDGNGDLLIGNQNGTETLKLATGRGIVDISTITAEIRVPYENSLISYSVPIIGTASANKFAKYTVEYGVGESPTEWTTLITSGTEVFDDNKPLPPTRTLYGNLATWHTAEKVATASGDEDYYIPMGVYTIRLTVYNQDGHFKDDTVKVEMANVGFRFGSTITSPDSMVSLELPDNAIPDDADLFSIKPAAEPPSATDEGLTPIGEIYEVKPAGYDFLKPCTLNFYYTDAQLSGIDEEKLNLFRWNPVTQQWVYTDAETDIENNVITASILNFNDYAVYYAVMSGSPEPPVIYPPASPSNLKTLTVHGVADPGIEVEVFANGVSQGTTQADEDTGCFSKTEVWLKTGENSLTARSVDPAGNQSSLSDPVSVEVILSQPGKVTSLDFKTDDFYSDFSDDVAMGDSLHIELVGTDADATSVNSTLVTLRSSNTDSGGISLQLLETAPNSGVYRGTARVSETSNASAGKIGVSYSLIETITVTSDVDPSKQNSLITADMFPPPAPGVTSATHPSLCQNTFEADLDEWANMSYSYGAEVTRSDETASSGAYSVRLTNIEEGGDFANFVRISPFDAEEYPMVRFDYKIPHDLKVNLIAYVNGMWKEIVFTDDPKTVETLDDNMNPGEDLYRPIGVIEDVNADNAWHHAAFNLYNMLKNDDPGQSEYIVEELFFADYDLTGWMELVMGEENPEGTAYHIDNFVISQGGKSDNDPTFTIIPDDASVVEYSHTLDQNPGTLPDEISEGASETVTYNDVADGVWYFHVRSLDGGGNWGPANHYQIKIDATGPVADSPTPGDGSSWGSMEIQIRITDGEGSGVDPDTLQIEVNGISYGMDSEGINYDEASEIMTFSLWKVVSEPAPWPDGSTVQASLTAADDFAGNPLESVFSWSWTVDYSELAGGYLSLLTTRGGFTPTWSSDGTKIVFMSKRNTDENISEEIDQNIYGSWMRMTLPKSEKPHCR